jgi:cytidylate kinase
VANLVVTIDGTAASGKSTAARLLADKLGASFLDTGAMYRAATLAALEEGVETAGEEKLLEVLEKNEFSFIAEQGRTMVRINNTDVTERIREPDVTANARHIASAPRVRAEMVRMQREFAEKHTRVITEGRDQGTVAFPDADVKFYLTADETVRAKRRQAELGARTGESVAQLQRAIEERDRSDQSRLAGPLRPADDAIVVDTTDLSIEEVAEKLLDFIRERCQ